MFVLNKTIKIKSLISSTLTTKTFLESSQKNK